MYWVDFGVPQGSESAGRRPAVVAQNDVGNRRSPTTVVAALGTRLPTRDYPFVVTLDARVLGEPTVIHCEHLRTVTRERLGDKLGGFGAADLDRLDAALRASLGL